MKNYSLNITPLANKDFEDILHYTLSEYGELQMENYADKIWNAFQSIKPKQNRENRQRSFSSGIFVKNETSRIKRGVALTF